LEQYCEFILTFHGASDTYRPLSSGPRKLMSGSPALELALSAALVYANIAPALIPAVWIVAPEALRSSIGTSLLLCLTASVAGVVRAQSQLFHPLTLFLQCFSRTFILRFFPWYSEEEFWVFSRFILPVTDVSTVVCLVLRLCIPDDKRVVETTEMLLCGPLMLFFLGGGSMDAFMYDVSLKPIVDEKAM